MKRRTSIIIVAIFVGMLVFFAIYDVSRTNKLMTQLERDFPELNINTGVDARIEGVYCPPKIRCSGGPVVWITLENATKVSIYATRDLENKVNLYDVLEAGCRLVVHPGSDTLQVFNKSRKKSDPFRFIINNNRR